MRRRLWGRSLLLQSCWNFERMQNIGLAYGLEPWLERVYPDPKDGRAALLRHQDFFNTNPYMEPLIVGMLCALEEEASREPAPLREEKFARLAALKKALASALAGIGDTLFWQTLRPLCAGAALLCGLLLWRAGLRGALPVMVVFYIAAYNAAAGTLRWRGFTLGYLWRDQIAVRLQDYAWQGWIRKLRLAGTALAGVLLVCALAWAGSPSQRLVGVLSLLICLIADRVLTRPMPAVRFYAGASALGVLAAMAGWL
jgi:mannose/fructose/N-acetylgalactosamine-specific phosphotransferase system component IID